MRIARIIYPVNVLGPGNRIGIWTEGCFHGCKGCSNPELWDMRSGEEISVDIVFATISRICEIHSIDGITITGGEPFLQAAELSRLTGKLRAVTSDILVYSGYTFQELRNMNDPCVDSILRNSAVLIDGKYTEEKNICLPLRGSSNQKIIILNRDYEKRYEMYLAKQTERHPVQNFISGRSIISVGIHSPGFGENFNNNMKKKGLGNK